MDDAVYAHLIGEARGWISDCVWANLEPDDVDDLTDEEIRRGVQRHYDGGWDAFVWNTLV